MCQKFTKKSTCSKSYAICVEYSGTLSKYTELDEESCYSVEEVLQDTINIVDSIKEDLDLSALEGECVQYPAGEKKLIDYLQTIQNFICSQNEIITQLQSDVTTLQAQVQELQNNPCS